MKNGHIIMGFATIEQSFLSNICLSLYLNRSQACELCINNFETKNKNGWSKLIHQ